MNILCSLLYIDYKSNEKFKNEGFYICSHAYEHADLFLIIKKLIEENKKATVVVADMWWNHLLYYTASLESYGIDFMYVSATKKNKTVKKIKKLLKNKQLVFIFLYENSPHKGIHYVLEDLYIKPTICRIKCDSNIRKTSHTDIFFGTLGKTFDIIIEENYEYIDITNLKKKLYS